MSKFHFLSFSRKLYLTFLHWVVRRKKGGRANHSTQPPEKHRMDIENYYAGNEIGKNFECECRDQRMIKTFELLTKGSFLIMRRLKGL